MSSENDEKISDLLDGVIDRLVKGEDEEVLIKILPVQVLLNKSLRLMNLVEFE